jgi:hypothetical protein
MPKIVFNRLLNGWFIVRGTHQTPISGRFDTKEEAKQWFNRKGDCKVNTIRINDDYISEIYQLDNGQTVYKFKG